MVDYSDKSVLNQLFDTISEGFEKGVYDSNNQIKEIENKVANSGDKFIDFLKQAIPNPDDYNKACEMFREYDLEYSAEITFWSKQYFNLGLKECKKILDELSSNATNK